MAIQQRDGFITGLEGTPIFLSTDAGKIRLYSSGPATSGICAVIPADPVIPETINRSYKRLVLNDIVNFFRNCRTFRIEKNGDNRYAFFAYDTPEIGSTQILPAVVSFLKPFHSLTNYGDGVGAYATMLYLSQYIPDNANVWGNGKDGMNIDGDFNSPGCDTFCFEYGVSSQAYPFTEVEFSDNDDNLSLNPNPPRITIAGKGKNSTFISIPAFSLSKLSVELRDLTIIGNITLSLNQSSEMNFSNVRVIGDINQQSESSMQYCRGNIEVVSNSKRYTLMLNGETATKLSAATNKNGHGFYRWVSTAFQEIAYWGDSTARRDDFIGILG